MKELTSEEIEEWRFRTRLQRSQKACNVVAEFLGSRGYKTQVLPLKIRPTFAERHAFGDNGDVIIWENDSAEPKKVEVKWRDVDFTCAEDFPYRTINVDRVKRTDLAFMYISTNRNLTHLLIIHSCNRDEWVIEKGTDPKRGYEPYDIYRCSKSSVEFVSLLPPPAPVANTFFGFCVCRRAGLYYSSGVWYCNVCRPTIWPA